MIALREMEAGVLLHSLYIDPKAAGKGVGRSLVNKAIFLTLETNHSRLIVKAFKEAVGFFTKVGFVESDILDYPYTLELSVQGKS